MRIMIKGGVWKNTEVWFCASHKHVLPKKLLPLVYWQLGAVSLMVSLICVLLHLLLFPKNSTLCYMHGHRSLLSPYVLLC